MAEPDRGAENGNPGPVLRALALLWPSVAVLRAESMVGSTATARALRRLRRYELAALAIFVLIGLGGISVLTREAGHVADIMGVASKADIAVGEIWRLAGLDPLRSEDAPLYREAIDRLERTQADLAKAAAAPDSPSVLRDLFQGQSYGLSARMDDLIIMARRLSAPIPPEEAEAVLADLHREISEQNAPRLAEAARLFHQLAADRWAILQGHFIWSGVAMLMLAILLALAFLPFETKQRRSIELLEWLAARDSLTGALNRGAFSARLAALLGSAKPDDGVGLIRFDIDDFRALNAANGDAAGDATLHAVARRLRRAAGAEALVGRLGSDAFAVALPNIKDGHTGLAQRASQLAHAVSRPLPFHDQLLMLSASAGFALAPMDSAERSELMRMAEVALRNAKREGKGAVFGFHTEETAAQARREAVLTALTNDDLRGLEPWLQPIVACKDGRPLRFEVLARWRHPTLGQISPAEFLPIAEAVGKLPRVSAEVRNAAFMALADIDTALLPARPLPGLSVNLAPAEMAMPELLPSLEASLAAAEISPDRLLIELAEDMLAGGGDTVAHAGLQDFRSRGAKLALDNFGTGFASLSSLHVFPLDTLKIARPFIAGIGNSARAEAIVRGVIGLAHGLGITAIAEGVENDAQMDFIRDAGCDGAQGYFISPPMPVSAVAEWLRARLPPSA